MGARYTTKGRILYIVSLESFTMLYIVVDTYRNKCIVVVSIPYVQQWRVIAKWRSRKNETLHSRVIEHGQAENTPRQSENREVKFMGKIIYIYSW